MRVRLRSSGELEWSLHAVVWRRKDGCGRDDPRAKRGGGDQVVCRFHRWFDVLAVECSMASEIAPISARSLTGLRR